MGNVKHTRVLFFWNDSFRDLNTLTHSFVLWHAERFRDSACPSTTSCFRPSNPQSELCFLGLSRSGYRGWRWRWLGHAWSSDRLGDLCVRLGLTCGFILFVGVVNNDGASGTQSGLANVRGSGGSDSDRCGPLGGRELWLWFLFRFLHRLAVFKRQVSVKCA